jgi:hypothetical protein
MTMHEYGSESVVDATSSERMGTSKNLLQTCDHISGFAAFDFEQVKTLGYLPRLLKDISEYFSHLLFRIEVSYRRWRNRSV